MAKITSKQKLADIIHACESLVITARGLYDDEELKDWAIQKSLDAQTVQLEAKNKLKDKFWIDFDSDDAKTKVVKVGSTVEVLANHMDGMKGSQAVIKSYSIPAMLSDITMKDGMKMNNHKWLTNDEVKL